MRQFYSKQNIHSCWPREISHYQRSVYEAIKAADPPARSPTPHTEYTFMSAAKRLLSNKTLERFHVQSKLPARERSLGAQTTRRQARQIPRHWLLRSVDDAQIFGAHDTSPKTQCSLVHNVHPLPH